MRHYQLTLRETLMLVAVAGAAANLWVVLRPHWGTIWQMMQDLMGLIGR